jgi:hypothetical protein
MFLGLYDAGLEQELEDTAKRLVLMTRKHRPDSRGLLRAEEVIRLMVEDRDRPGGPRRGRKALEKVLGGRPLYMILQFVAEAFDEPGEVQYAGGGDHLVCDVIRRRIPLAPEGFRRAGSMTGNPKQPAEFSERCWPNKTTLKQYGRQDPDPVLPQVELGHLSRAVILVGVAWLLSPRRA